MQNKYVGDVGDFGKYGLMKALCRGDEETELKLGVVWYLVSEKGLEYLSEGGKSRFTKCDDELYAKLKGIVQARSVSAIELGDVLPADTTFFGEAISGKSMREAWLDRAVDRMRDCEVVFLDPDTGLKDPPERRDDARGREYAYLDEVSRFAEHGGDRSVVIYHHLGRAKHNDQITDLLERLRRRFPRRSPFALRFRPYSPRAFLVAPALAHQERLVRRACTVEGKWKGHFELMPSRTELCPASRDSSLRSE